MSARPLGNLLILCGFIGAAFLPTGLYPHLSALAFLVVVVGAGLRIEAAIMGRRSEDDVRNN